MDRVKFTEKKNGNKYIYILTLTTISQKVEFSLPSNMRANTARFILLIFVAFSIHSTITCSEGITVLTNYLKSEITQNTPFSNKKKEVRFSLFF